MIKNGKNKNNKGKCVEIFKDDISLGIFKQIKGKPRMAASIAIVE